MDVSDSRPVQCSRTVLCTYVLLHNEFLCELGNCTAANARRLVRIQNGYRSVTVAFGRRDDRNDFERRVIKLRGAFRKYIQTEFKKHEDI